MKPVKKFALILALPFVGFGFGGCDDNDVGDDIGDAIDDVADDVEDAVDDITDD